MIAVYDLPLHSFLNIGIPLLILIPAPVQIVLLKAVISAISFNSCMWLLDSLHRSFTKSSMTAPCFSLESTTAMKEKNYYRGWIALYIDQPKQHMPVNKQILTFTLFSVIFTLY